MRDPVTITARRKNLDKHVEKHLECSLILLVLKLSQCDLYVVRASGYELIIFPLPTLTSDFIYGFGLYAIARMFVVGMERPLSYHAFAKGISPLAISLP